MESILLKDFNSVHFHLLSGNPPVRLGQEFGLPIVWIESAKISNVVLGLCVFFQMRHLVEIGVRYFDGNRRRLGVWKSVLTNGP